MSTKTTYKQTELGLIPEDWELKKLGKVGEIDKKSLNSNTDKEYEFDYISLSDVDSDQFSIKTSKQKFKNAPSRARRIVKKGDVLLSTVRPNLEGFTIIRDEVKDLIASTGFAVITSKNELHNEYLFNFLFSNIIKRQFHKLLVGSNYPAINSSDVKNLKIPLPPLSEQKKIADCLSTWDVAIEKQNALINALTDRKKALMQQLLTGKKRLPGFSGEWKEVKLGEIIIDYKEKPNDNNNYEILTSSKNGLMKQTDYYGDNRITNRTDADYNVIPNGFITYRSRSDDGLFTFNLNDLGVIGLISGYYPVFSFAKSNTQFLLSFLNYFKSKLIKYAIGTSQLVLSINALKEAKFKLPSLEEQTAIAEILATADRELQLQKEKLAQLQTQKKGLMQVLLTGKKRLIN